MPFWKRSQKIQLTKHFNSDEFCCRCQICSDQVIDSQALAKLEALRQDFGAPITVTSAFRCARHQAVLRSQGVETAKGVSSHELGIAFDLTCDDLPKLAQLAENHFNNIGLARTFIHVDTRFGGPRRWTYK